MNKKLSTPRIHNFAVPSGWGLSGCLVVVPARNEADRIEGCLDALAGQGADVLVVANNCTDATANLASGSGAAVIDCTIADGGVGAARRLGASFGLRQMATPRWLMTSDADCLVAPGWVETNISYLAGGAAAVCGMVQPIAAEHAALPPALLRRAALEDRFLDGAAGSAFDWKGRTRTNAGCEPCIQQVGLCGSGRVCADADTRGSGDHPANQVAGFAGRACARRGRPRIVSAGGSCAGRYGSRVTRAQSGPGRAVVPRYGAVRCYSGRRSIEFSWSLVQPI